MKLKKLASLLLVLMMLMSALTITAEGGATNVLECVSYTTSANGQYYEVDLDNLHDFYPEIKRLENEHNTSLVYDF